MLTKQMLTWESLNVYVLSPSLLAGDCWALRNENCSDFLSVWFSICCV